MTPQEKEHLDYIKSSRIWKIAYIIRMAEQDGLVADPWENRYYEDVPFLLELVDRQRWISTAERMPEDRVDVLAVLPIALWNPNVLAACIDPITKQWQIETRYGVQYVPLEQVTMWMPVPTAPAVQQLEAIK